jgi:hypothetical protein
VTYPWCEGASDAVPPYPAAALLCGSDVANITQLEQLAGDARIVHLRNYVSNSSPAVLQIEEEKTSKTTSASSSSASSASAKTTPAKKEIPEITASVEQENSKVRLTGDDAGALNLGEGSALTMHVPTVGWPAPVHQEAIDLIRPFTASTVTTASASSSTSASASSLVSTLPHAISFRIKRSLLTEAQRQMKEKQAKQKAGAGKGGDEDEDAGMHSGDEAPGLCAHFDGSAFRVVSATKH